MFEDNWLVYGQGDCYSYIDQNEHQNGSIKPSSIGLDIGLEVGYLVSTVLHFALEN